jgi:hypothetical protein
LHSHLLPPAPQALWVRAWLLEHLQEALQPGWTYLFEAVYPDNTHVVQYSFEGPVLLTAVAPDGREVRGAAARQALARRLGVLAAPSLEGPWEELGARLARGTAASPGSGAASSVSASGSQRDGEQLQLALPTFEGWVLEAPSGERHKLVQTAFKRAGAAAQQLLHPLVLWDELDAARPAWAHAAWAACRAGCAGAPVLQRGAPTGRCPGAAREQGAAGRR